MQKSIISHDSLGAILPKKDPVEAVLRRVMQGPALEGQGGHRRRCEVRVQGDLLKLFKREKTLKVQVWHL